MNLQWLNFSSWISPQFWGFCIVITIIIMILGIMIDNMNESYIIIFSFILCIILTLFAFASRGLL